MTKQLVAINSTWLVDSMDSLSPTISKEWIGLILLPTVSSIAGMLFNLANLINSLMGLILECVTSINVSVKDQLSLSISVAVGSTIVCLDVHDTFIVNPLTDVLLLKQTALFVIPAMVLLGWVLDKPLALLFDPFESVVSLVPIYATYL